MYALGHIITAYNQDSALLYRNQAACELSPGSPVGRWTLNMTACNKLPVTVLDLSLSWFQVCVTCKSLSIDQNEVLLVCDYAELCSVT